MAIRLLCLSIRKNIKNILISLSAIGITLLLAACGGGSSTPKADASLPPAITTSPVSRVATAGDAVAFSVTATGSVGPITGTATVTVSANTATTIALKVGDGQSATVGTAVAIPPSVLVTDTYGNPVSGVPVTFAVTSGGGSVTGQSYSCWRD